MKLLLCLSLFFLLSLACSGSGQVLEAAQTDPSPTPPPPTPAVSSGVVCADHLNLRQAPGTQSAILTVLTRGQLVALTHQRETAIDGGTWVRVERNSLSGWVNLNYLCGG